MMDSMLTQIFAKSMHHKSHLDTCNTKTLSTKTSWRFRGDQKNFWGSLLLETLRFLVDLPKSVLVTDLKVLKAIQLNFTPGKVWRITKRDPTPEFFSGEFGQYDSVIKQAILTQTQKQAYYYQLLQLREIGIAIPDDEIIDAAPLQGKTRLRAKMQEIAQAQQEAAKIEMETANRQAQLEASQIDNNLALAQERRARVVADIGLARERISEAEQNKAKALLDNAKTFAEIEDLDRNHFLEVMRFAHETTIAEDERITETLQKDQQLGQSLTAGEPNG